MSNRVIGNRLGVTDETAAKAIRWLETQARRAAKRRNRIVSAAPHGQNGADPGSSCGDDGRAMAYLEGFEHDVFVSYAHIDNRPDREGERGWVEAFERALRLRLLKRFGREVAVWRDPELDRSQRFDPVIEQAVRGSAVMISLISRSYLASDYCRQELAWFAEKAVREPAGLEVDHHVRVFPLLLYNIPPHEWPEVCRAISGFAFHDAAEREFGKPLHPDRDDFTDRLCRVVEEIHTVLTAMSRQATEPGAPAIEAAGARRVFLADVADDLRRDRRLLRQRLESEGIEVVSSIPPPDRESQHEAAVLDALRRSALSIHLLGGLPGRPLDDEAPEKTYPVEQVRIGLHHARSQLVLLPPGLAREDIREPEYASFVTSLQERHREAEQLEIIQAGGAQLAEAVLAKLGRLNEREAAAQAQAVSGAAGRAFVDLHVNDLPVAGDLVGYLNRHEIPAITIPSADLDPAAGLSLFEEHLRSARVFIVVFGRVARSWVDQRLNEAFKLILSKRLATRMGVYLAPPHKSASDAAFPSFFRVMNNSGHFDPATVDALLRDPPGTP